MSCVEPSQQTASSQVVEVFSALAYYSESSAGITSPSGIKTAQLFIPSSGIHRVEPSSLEWVDGFYAQNRDCEEFVSAIERRELPAPLISHTPHRLGHRCVYTSAELLAHSDESILAACGLVEVLLDTALASPTASCPSCNGTALRISTPLALGDLLLRDFDSQHVSITASSDDEKFGRWAASIGFSTMQDSARNAPVAILESGVCSTSLIARLGSVLRSSWTIPRLTFTCRSSSATRVYAPQGWCPTCTTLLAAPDRAALTKLLQTGCVYSELSTDACKLERSLMLHSNLRIEDIISTPLRSLQTSEIATLQELSGLLIALELGDYPLSTALCTLPAEDIAMLSIAISLYRSRCKRSTVVVDLPSGILHRKQESVRSIAALSDYKAHSIILLGDPFASPEKQGTTPLATSLIRDEIKGTPARDSGDSNCEPERSSWIPLFPSREKLTRTIGDELGLIHGVAQLYAASIDARCLGLTAKDFSLTGARSHPHLCRGCKGLGVTLFQSAGLPRPRAKPCVLCLGKRFREPVASTLFGGVSYSALLNRPIKSALNTLRALPRTKDLLECLELLGLVHLPLGMPTALLSCSELRRVQILKGILAARPGHKQTITIEAPQIGFTQAHRNGIQALQQLPFLTGRCRWVEDYKTGNLIGFLTS